MKVVDMPGGGVYKDSDREAGVVEPSGTDMAEFLTNYLEIQMKRENGFLYAPGKQSKGVGWKKKLIYRVEAVTSLTYGVLHTLSFEDEIDAVEYQRGEYFEKFVRQRLIRGWLAADKKVNDDFHKRSVERLEKLINSEKIIRSTPPGTLETVLGLLVKK